MMLNYIWVGFFLVAFVVAVIQFLFLGDATVFERIITSTFDMSKVAVMDIALPLAGVMTLWLLAKRPGLLISCPALSARSFPNYFPKFLKTIR